jgi:predicted RNA binding protein YcfA (HicA-like mRNA interferase family)
MPLKGLSYLKVAHKLRNAGFKEVSQRGNHIKFAK